MIKNVPQNNGKMIVGVADTGVIKLAGHKNHCNPPKGTGVMKSPYELCTKRCRQREREREREREK